MVAHLGVRRAFSLLVPSLRGSGSREIETLLLRHERELLYRNPTRPCLQPTDRTWHATLGWR